MATYIKTLKEDNGDVTYPQTVADAVRTTKGTTVQTELNQAVTAEPIASTSALTPPVQTNMIADEAVTTGKIADGAVTIDKLEAGIIKPIWLHVVGNWGNYASFFQIVTDCPWSDINSAAKLANYLWTHGHSTDGYARIPVTGNNPTKGGASVALYAATSSTLKDSVGDYTFQNMHLMSIRLL